MGIGASSARRGVCENVCRREAQAQTQTQTQGVRACVLMWMLGCGGCWAGLGWVQ